MFQHLLTASIVTVAKRNEFYRVFVHDLMPHQDDADDAAAVVDGAREVVAWYAANEPSENVVDAADAAAFMAWIDANRARLIEVVDFLTEDDA